jgi:hypothetical protein
MGLLISEDTILPSLVAGFNSLEKYESQWEGLSHILWRIYKMFQTTNQILPRVMYAA